MRKMIFTVAAALSFVVGSYAADIVVERPAASHPSSFAIVIDAETYSRCKGDVEAYRAALERDNLAVYTISSAWTSPEQVRAELKKLHKANLKKMPLEGVVFVGDVPFVSVRNAQHMTTAFKMNEQSFPMEESSVTSDRYYDDLNLEFEYIKQDSVNKLRFYYKLTESSPQHLNPSFYSGRILYPSDMGGDKYEAISKYLRKVVAERERNEALDYMVTYKGNGYNSDCLISWLDERYALDEMFPQLDRNDYMSLVQLNFRMEEYMKYKVYDQLAREEVDVMLFNEHGSPDKQHLSGTPDPEDFTARVEALRDELYYYLRYEKRRGGDVDALIEEFKQEYKLTDKFFEEYRNPSEKEQEDHHNLVLDDLRGRATMPRFVMFNACYNGSFHQDGYIAGSYIFSDGRTVVAQGNTVNVLQDRWTYEMLGLISHGVRIGQYNRFIATLEGHIIGDPAFRFASIDDLNLAKAISTKPCVVAGKSNAQNVAYWRALIDEPNADVQSVALRMLADGGELTADELLAKFRECPYGTTRMECLKLLARFGNTPQMVDAVAEALYDRYEVVRRNAAKYCWMLGREELCDEIADVMVNYPESQRVGYTLRETAMQILPGEAAISSINEAIAECAYPEYGRIAPVARQVERLQARKVRDMETLFNKEADLKARISAIRGVRNNTYHEYVPQFIELMQDESQSAELRIVVAEALGWFVLSPNKQQIIDACRELKTSDEELAAEALQTINRLK